MSASKITHDRDKKTIDYQNVWLKIYDLPVVYFPKFFHPDPTVKRQSGFLMPYFKNSSNNNSFLSVPYFRVLGENKDLTFTPRIYSNDQLLFQNEYREKNKKGEIISDFSFHFDEGDNIESHFFYKAKKNVDLEIFPGTDIELKIETASNDTYLKANSLNSPLIDNYDLLETSLKMDMNSDDLNIKSDLIIYQNLNKKSSDKYEYIFPKVKITKKIENKTKLNGKFELKSNNFIHNYQTNIYERVNTNDLIFNSEPKIFKNGFYNNYEFILKNSNTNSDKSKFHKEGEDYYFSGLFQFNSSYPLVKKNNKYTKLIKPKLSLKISPTHTKDISKNENKINVDNIFDLNRISSEETLEGGISFAYGNEYSLVGNDNKEIFSLKVANNLRLEKNDDLERNNQIGAKTSNFFGEINYTPSDFLNTKYKFSTLNNLTDINYQNLITEIEFKNFITTLDYLKQDNNKNSYFLNKTTYNFNKSNNISFSSRENLNTDLIEFYNLVYQYKNDCLTASVEYKKEYYNDREIKPEESVFFKLSIIPFGSTSTPNLKP